jgi:hypothetical protein
LATLAAIQKQRTSALSGAVRERLDDADEDADVRAVAARTLGAQCIQKSVDRLTDLALRSRAPVDEADETIGVAAIEALGTLHPSDLAARLAPLRQKQARSPVRQAVERALLEVGSCH